MVYDCDVPWLCNRFVTNNQMVAVQWFLGFFEFLLIGMIGIFWSGCSWEWDGMGMGMGDWTTPRLLMLFSCTRLFGTQSCGMIFWFLTFVRFHAIRTDHVQVHRYSFLGGPESWSCRMILVMQKTTMSLMREPEDAARQKDSAHWDTLRLTFPMSPNGTALYILVYPSHAGFWNQFLAWGL